VDAEIIEAGGVRVAVGGVAPDPRLPAGADPLEGVEWCPEADLSILLVHGSLEGHIYPGAPEPIIRRETVERLGADCLFAGHVHRFASFRWGRTSVVVPGATERMTFGEADTRPGFVYLELEPERPAEISHIPVGPQPRRQMVLASGELDEDNPAETVKQRLDELCGRDVLVKLSLEGPITRQRYHELRMRELAEYGAARCFFLDLDTTGLYVEDDLPRLALRTGRLSPREELLRYGEEVRDASGTAVERALIDEAMSAILSEYE
jgi:DNA repair exonuclease SbcCD nuclease subunit